MAAVERNYALLRPIDRQRIELAADWLAVAVVVLLPWSTSAVSILGAIFAVAVLLTLNAEGFRRIIETPAGGLPLLMFVIALVGVAWAFGMPASHRVHGLEGFVKLLVIPLLMFHFFRSGRGHWVLIGFLVSCTILLALSWFMYAFPTKLWRPKTHFGIPVRDYIAQSAEFTICVFVLARLALDNWSQGRRGRSIGLLLLALVFFVNIVVVAFSRTVLVVFPILLLVFAWKHLSYRTAVATIVAGVVVAALSWAALPQLRDRILEPFESALNYSPDAAYTSSGLRLDYWRRSIDFISDAPVFGHGTGSVNETFRRAAVGRTGVGGDATTNPHNQTFAVAVQLGFVGAVVLIAMWIAHLMIFRGDSFLAWIGLAIVLQNVVGSLFNSHLFDFGHGWGYVYGCGVAAGMMLRHLLGSEPSRSPAPAP